MVSPVSKVIKAENFVVNRILEITPWVEGGQVSTNLHFKCDILPNLVYLAIYCVKSALRFIERV